MKKQVAFTREKGLSGQDSDLLLASTEIMEHVARLTNEMNESSPVGRDKISKTTFEAYKLRSGNERTEK